MDSIVYLDAKTYSNNHRLVKEIVFDATKQFFPFEAFQTSPCLSKQTASIESKRRTCTILDLGCGTCENTKWFATKVGANKVVGLDWNPNFLKFATDQSLQKDATSLEESPELNLHLVDLNKLSWHTHLPAIEYDLISSFLTLHWIKNLTNCLESLKQLMRPNRTLMFHVLGIRPGLNFQATMKDLAMTQKWGPTIKEFAHSTRWQDPAVSDWRVAPDPAAAFADILCSAGFSVRVCQKMAFTYTTESEAECRGHLSWLVPFTSQLPEAERASLMDDFMAAYSRHTRQLGPGRYVWENEVLVVLAARRGPGEMGDPVGGCQ